MKQSAQDRILTVAGTLFYREGIRAIGIDRIILEADVAKATLYRHFPSKDHLVAAYLEQRHGRVLQNLAGILADHQAPRDRIAALFTALHAKAGNAEFRGCAFALAVSEHGDSERVVEVARRHKDAITDLLREVLLPVLSEPLASDAAAQMALLYEGALSLMAIRGTPDAALVARASALTLFDLAVQQTPAASKMPHHELTDD